MSEYPIKCSCDGLLLYDTKLLIGMTRYGHLHMTNMYTPACVNLKQPQSFEILFVILARVFYFISNQKRLRPVLKPNLVVKIETIPWCPTKCSANLSCIYSLDNIIHI